jgi:hypothetical protein
MSISRVMADGIATHRALKLVGRVGHHIMAAATVAQANMHRTVFMLTSPGLSRELQNFPFLAGYDVGDMIGPDGQ